MGCRQVCNVPRLVNVILFGDNCFYESVEEALCLLFFPGVREKRDFMVSVDMNPLEPISMVTRFGL